MCPHTTLECVLLEIRLCRLHNSDNIIPLGKGEVWLQSMGEGVSSSGQLGRRVDCSVSGREGVGMRGTSSLRGNRESNESRWDSSQAVVKEGCCFLEGDHVIVQSWLGT